MGQLQMAGDRESRRATPAAVHNLLRCPTRTHPLVCVCACVCVRVCWLISACLSHQLCVCVRALMYVEY